MKKLLALFMLAFGITFSLHAQEKVKTEVKPTTTVSQKVHNTFSRKKYHKGYKVKHKHANGHKQIKKVNHITGEVKRKHKVD